MLYNKDLTKVLQYHYQLKKNSYKYLYQNFYSKHFFEIARVEII